MTLDIPRYSSCFLFHHVERWISILTAIIKLSHLVTSHWPTKFLEMNDLYSKFRFWPTSLYLWMWCKKCIPSILTASFPRFLAGKFMSSHPAVDNHLLPLHTLNGGKTCHAFNIFMTMRNPGNYTSCWHVVDAVCKLVLFHKTTV